MSTKPTVGFHLARQRSGASNVRHPAANLLLIADDRRRNLARVAVGKTLAQGSRTGSTPFQQAHVIRIEHQHELSTHHG